MKKALLISFTAISCGYTLGQAPFSRGFEINTYYRTGKVIQTPNDNFIIFGGTAMPYGGVLLSADANGNLTCAKRFPQFSDGTYAVVFTSSDIANDSTMIFTARADLPVKGSMVKSDINGDFLWVYNVDLGLDVSRVTSEGNYLFAGRNDLSGPFLYKVSPAGSLIFGKDYLTGDISYDGGQKVVYDIVEHSNGDYFMLANMGNGIFILRINSNGTLVWRKKYLDDIWSYGDNSAQGGGKLLLMADGSIMVTGAKGSALLAFKIDTNGNILWSKKYYSSMYLDPKNAFFNADSSVSIYAYAANPWRHLILEINQSGTLLNAYTLKDSGYPIYPVWLTSDNYHHKLLLHEIADTSAFAKTIFHRCGLSINNECLTDSAVVFSDSSNVLSAPQDFTLYPPATAPLPQPASLPLTLQSCACFNPCANIGISEINSVVAPADIFPNPFTTHVTIRFNEKIHNGTLRFYNTLGKAVLEKNNLEGNQTGIDAGILSQGVYLYEVTDDDKKIYSGKVIVY